MGQIKFSEMREDIQNALNKKLTQTPISDEAGFSIIEGFMNMPIHSEVSSSIIAGGPNIPMVGIVGNSSGRIYFYALKAILPDVKI